MHTSSLVSSHTDFILVSLHDVLVCSAQFSAVVDNGGSSCLFQCVMDCSGCCVYPVVVSVIEPEGGYGASWTPSHLLWSAKQWEPSGFYAVSKRHGDQHEGEYNNLNFLNHECHFVSFFFCVQ